MKQIHIILFSIFITINLYGQPNEEFRDGNGFNSAFQKLRSGEFSGTTNGILIIENLNGAVTILDFQGSFGKLEIVEDEYEVYDVSTKKYTGKTTSGITEIRYETYARANSIGIHLMDQWFELSAIDGGCFLVINGIDYYYAAEESAEYLVINISKELILSNWQFLLRTEHTMEPDNINELKPKRKTIKVLPNSTIAFAINR